jgi:arsenate reductase (thioredoxin)
MMAAILAAASVVFVCEHGNVKSLIAMQWFNRLAVERHLSARAVSRGLTPENPVPPPIRRRLKDDGFDVSSFEARPLASGDLDGATRLVMIGADAPPWAHRAGLQVETWTAIPPASESYAASRDALRERIAALLATLAPAPASPPSKR